MASWAAAVADGASPTTLPGPLATCQAMVSMARVRVFPVPAGPTRTSRRRPEVAIPVAAACWSGAVRCPGIGRTTRSRQRRGQRRRGEVVERGQQVGFGVEDRGGGERRVLHVVEDAGPVEAAELGGGVERRRRVQRHARRQRRLHDLVEQLQPFRRGADA